MSMFGLLMSKYNIEEFLSEKDQQVSTEEMFEVTFVFH